MELFIGHVLGESEIQGNKGGRKWERLIKECEKVIRLHIGQASAGKGCEAEQV